MMLAQINDSTTSVLTVGGASALAIVIGAQIMAWRKSRREDKIAEAKDARDLSNEALKTSYFERIAVSNEAMKETLTDIKLNQAHVCKANCGNFTLAINNQPQEKKETKQ